MLKEKMHEITYLNCTLTVSSNQHVGLLKKKKKHCHNSPLTVFFPLFFFEEVVKYFAFSFRYWGYI